MTGRVLVRDILDLGIDREVDVWAAPFEGSLGIYALGASVRSRLNNAQICFRSAEHLCVFTTCRVQAANHGVQ